MSTYSISPRVMRETTAGMFFYTIQDDMLQRREVELVGAIDTDSVYELCRQLRYLQNDAPNKEITMFINSPGGEVDSGLALYDVMKGISCPIRTVCMGIAASMGAVLFAAGNKREILPHGRVMIHDPLLDMPLGDAYLFTRGAKPRKVRKFDIRSHERYHELPEANVAQPVRITDVPCP